MAQVTRRNLARDPNAANVATTAWDNNNVVTITQTEGWAGFPYAYTSTRVSSGAARIGVRGSLSAGKEYVARFHVRVSAPIAAAVWYRANTTVTVDGQESLGTHNLPAGESFLELVFTPSASASIDGGIAFIWANDVEEFSITGVQIEEASTIGPFFSGSTAPSANTMYMWEGAANNSSSLAITIPSRRPACGLYMGTEEHQQWVPAPDENVTINSEGWGASGTYLNGGSYIRRSATRSKAYSLSWTELNGESLAAISDFYDGLYGDGPFYFALPGTYANILPQSWATPRLACIDALPLVEDTKPRPLAAPSTDRGFPTASALYEVTDAEARRQVLPIYVPEDMVLHLGVRGSFSGTAHIEYKVNDTANTLPPVDGDALTNRYVLGPAKVELSLQGTGSATINSMTASLRASFLPPRGKFVSGKGHSGVQFPENGMTSTLISAARDAWSAAVTIREVAQWQ